MTDMATPPDDRAAAQALVAAAVEHLGAGRPADAEQALSQALAFNPHHSQAHYLRALIAQTRGELAVALGHLVAGLAWERHRSEPFALGGHLLQALGDSALAAAFLKRALAIAPVDPRAPGWLKEVLLQPRASTSHPELACLAVPPTVALSMIVKNEGVRLQRCLEAARPFVDEIVVLDTGSTDDTVAIAQAAGARIGHFSWCNDFAAARNACLDLVTAQWVLVLDADEILEAEPDALRKLLATTPVPELTGCVPVMSLELINQGGTPLDEGEWHREVATRFFQRAYVRYEGAIHEQATVKSPPNQPLDTYKIACNTARIQHYGYRTDMLLERDKVARNVKLLREQAAREPADKPSHTYFFLGRESSYAGEYAEAIAALTTFWERWPAGQHEAYPRQAFFFHTVSLVGLARHAEALALLDRAQALDADYPSFWYLRGTVLEALGDLAGARAGYERALLGADYHEHHPLRPYNAILPEHAGPAPKAALARLAGPAIAVVQPPDPDIHQRLKEAFAILSEGKLLEAEAALTHVARLDPNHSQLPYLRALLALRRDALELALSWAHSAVLQAPQRGEPWALVGYILHERGDSRLGAHFLARGLQLAPELSTAKRWLDATQRFPRAYREHPDVAALWHAPMPQ